MTPTVDIATLSAYIFTMAERDYTLKDLAMITRLDPRTIRFYIAQKLLKGPDGKGRHAKYSEYHLKRLEVIKKLSRKYKMPLKEIRSHLMKARDDEDIELAEVMMEEPHVLREESESYSASPGMMVWYIGSFL